MTEQQDMTPDEAQRAFQKRRHTILRKVEQLKRDVDSYNDNFNEGSDIIMVYDFCTDLEEAEA